jgi:hypothetical protein
MEMGDMRIRSAIFAPFPIQNMTSDFAVVNNVFDSLVASFSALANLLN